MMNLQQRIDEGTLAARVAVVIASRPCRGLEWARQVGLDGHLVPYKTTLATAYADAITARLDQAGVDLVVMAGFLSLWPIPPAYEGRVVNIHPSLLPSFGGQGMFGHHVHEAVLRRGCKVSGCTVHFVTNAYDEGPILVQKTVPVLEDDTPDTLAARVFEQETLALPEALQLLAEGRVTVENDVARIKS